MLDHVIYPPEYDPRISPIYALNEIDVRAPSDVVWRLLVGAENWSSYFPPESQVKILSGEPELRVGTKWSRVTIGFPMHLVVTECVPARRLSWSTTVDGDETGSTAFHGWVITPTADGCHVLSEETQQGPWFLDQLGRKHPGGLYSYHQDWVEALARGRTGGAQRGLTSPGSPIAADTGAPCGRLCDVCFSSLHAPDQTVRYRPKSGPLAGRGVGRFWPLTDRPLSGWR